MYPRRAGLEAIPHFKMMGMRVEFLCTEKHGMAEREAHYFVNALAFRLYLHVNHLEKFPNCIWRTPCIHEYTS